MVLFQYTRDLGTTERAFKSLSLRILILFPLSKVSLENRKTRDTDPLGGPKPLPHDNT